MSSSSSEETRPTSAEATAVGCPVPAGSSSDAVGISAINASVLAIDASIWLSSALMSASVIVNVWIAAVDGDEDAIKSSLSQNGYRIKLIPSTLNGFDLSGIGTTGKSD